MGISDKPYKMPKVAIDGDRNAEKEIAQQSEQVVMASAEGCLRTSCSVRGLVTCRENVKEHNGKDSWEYKEGN